MATPAAPALVADCEHCFALCCVLLPFSAVSGFGMDKPGGTPCPNLADDDRCSIHATLRRDGWSGCVTFDCFGAGQQVSQVTYAGVSWRESDNLGEMAAVLSVMRLLHEMLSHLAEVARRSPHPGAAALTDEILVLTAATPVELLAVDLDNLHDRVGAALEAASARLRRGTDLRGRDLAGHDLRDQPLGDADLRGSLLIRWRRKKAHNQWRTFSITCRCCGEKCWNCSNPNRTCSSWTQHAAAAATLKPSCKAARTFWPWIKTPMPSGT